MAQRNNFESRPENVERINKLMNFISAHKDGDTITWLDIEKATGIPCRSPARDVDGRGLTRRALHKMGREVETIHAVGFRLSSPDNTMPIMEDQLQRTHRRIKRAVRSGSNLFAAHGQQLSAGARDRLTRSNALLSTLSATATDGRKLLK